jgi:Cu-Zn family superoxide dismutase
MQQRTFVARLACTAVATLGINLAYASVAIPIVLFNADGQAKNIGSISAEDSFCGVLLKPNLTNLPPGVHGFHVHVNPSCEQNGMAAGGHLDPGKTDQHDGPYNKKGHLGDMPVLIVDQDGNANLPTLAPKFKLADIMGHAIMIHAGGDNYSDKPEKLGGGGERIACGVIKKS